MTHMIHSRLIRIVAIGLLAVLAAACNGASGPEDAATTVDSITLERQPCFGFCPVYTVTLHGDGRVEYNGADFVEVTGPQTATIDPAAVQALADRMIAAGYLDMNDEYLNQEVTDHPYAITSLTLTDGTTKRIAHYYGDSSAPAVLTELETAIDETAGTAQWTEGSG